MKSLRICIAALFISLATSAALATDWQRVKLGSASEDYEFPVYANHDLNTDLTRIREIVIIIHGIKRNGDDYFAAGESLLKESGRAASDILILAPNFPGVQDEATGFENMPRWGTRDWSAGLDAKMNPLAVNPFALSAFKVLDDLLLKITDQVNYPNLTNVTLAGHSAGAQLVQRYAVLNQVDERIRARSVELRYVVANPSSFLYFNTQRPTEQTFKEFPAEHCPAFNDYRYGMQDMIPYGQGKSGQALFKRYSYRNVVYLMGGDDRDPDHKFLDKSCPALAQGPTRLSRAQAYVRYERFLAGRSTKINHLAYEVVGVGHNQSKMFGSTCGMLVLFQTHAPKGSHAAICQPYLF